MAVVMPAVVDDTSTPAGQNGTILTKAVWDAVGPAVDTAIAAAVGSWTDVAFVAGNFTGNGSMTWTVASGDVGRNRYMKIGKLLVWQLYLSTTTVGGTPNVALQVALPTGTFPTVTHASSVAYINDNGTIRDGYASPASGTLLGFFLSSGANWTASTDGTYIRAVLLLELS